MDSADGRERSLNDVMELPSARVYPHPARGMDKLAGKRSLREGAIMKRRGIVNCSLSCGLRFCTLAARTKTSAGGAEIPAACVAEGRGADSSAM